MVYKMTGLPTHMPNELTAHEGRIKTPSLVIVVTRAIPKSGVTLPHITFEWFLGSMKTIRPTHRITTVEIESNLFGLGHPGSTD